MSGVKLKAVSATTGLLEDVKSKDGMVKVLNEALNISAETINLSTDGLETLLNGGLPSALTGSGNLKVCLQELGNEGSERLNVDVGATNTKLPSALTGAGNLKVSIQEHFGAGLATESKQGGGLPSALTGSGNLKVAIEEGSSGGDASANNQTTMISHLSEIEGAVETIEGCVGSSKVNVNISSGNISGFATSALQTDMESSLDSILAKNGEIESSLNSLISANHTDLLAIDGSINTIEGCVGSNKVNVNISSGNISGFATSALQGDIESSLNSILAKNTEIETSCDALITANHTDLVAIDGSINTIEACVGSNKLNVNISSGGFDGAITNSHLTELGSAINSDRVDVNIANGGFDGAITNSHLTELGSAINSNKMDVNIVSGNISGFATSALQTDMESSLDSILAKNTEIETSCDALITANHTDLVAIDAVLDTIKIDTEAIETAVEVLSTQTTKVSTQMLFGSSNEVNNGTPESSTNSIELKNNGSEYIGILIVAENTFWNGFFQWSVDNSNWYDDELTFNGSSSAQHINNYFKKAKYVRVRIINNNGVAPQANAFTVYITQ